MRDENEKSSDVLRDLLSKHTGDTISMHDITEGLRDRGFAILLLLFAFPMALPLPYPPGFSSLVSLPLLFLSLQMTIGRKSLYLPDMVGRKTMKTESLRTIIEKILPYLQKLELYFKPNREHLLSARIEQLIGFFSLVLAGCIMLPLSVLSNTIPAAGISIMALGMLERDGRAVIAGFVVGLVGFIISILAVAVIFLGAKLIIGGL
ncbi:MAG: exopolysaccharide biosynthesis protein [Alphaproteobacteria bacterium]|nr:exopolysaccharide biosynthesis protein [Alphaproteobacteria bacterium]